MSRSRFLLLPLVLSLLSAARGARAEGSPGETPNEASGTWATKGLYLRLSLGAGLVDVDRNTTRSGSGTSYLFLGDESSIRSAAAATELSIGGTPMPGLVVAGTWMGLAIPGVSLELVDGTTGELDGSLSAFFLGPTVDVFPTETGVHFGGGAGYLAYSASAPEPPGNIGGRGAGVLVLAGYDFWTDDEWAIGLAARGMLGQVAGSHESASFTGEETSTVLLAGIVASVLLY